jgi:hypothetical protein
MKGGGTQLVKLASPMSSAYQVTADIAAFASGCVKTPTPILHTKNPQDDAIIVLPR